MIRDEKKEFPKAINYVNVREELRTGDVVIFGGQYFLSRVIRLVTRFPASHIATIIRDENRISYVEASEGDMYPEREGVIVSHFSNSIPFYKGDIWIARLRQEVRENLDEGQLKSFIMEQVGKGYDYKSMPKAGLDFLEKFNIGKNKENWNKMFCSELVAAGLKHAGVLPESANTSELSPADIIKMSIYEQEYFQIKAFKYKAVKLPGFNSVSI